MTTFALDFAGAKIAKISGMKTKKIAFLLFFLSSMTLGFSQNTVNQQKNSENTYRVKIETSYGNIVVKLYNETPRHRDNFIKLVRDGVYNDVLFHRVIKNFMIQGGDPNSRNAKPGQMLGNGTLGYTIPAEFNSALIHKKGALAAARMGDDVNPKKESSSCQFYIVQGEKWDASRLRMVELQSGKKFTKEQAEIYATVGGTPFLDGEYTVFGEVVEGLDVVDKIASVVCGPMDRPVEDVKMKMTVIE